MINVNEASCHEGILTIQRQVPGSKSDRLVGVQDRPSHQSRRALKWPGGVEGSDEGGRNNTGKSSMGDHMLGFPGKLSAAA